MNLLAYHLAIIHKKGATHNVTDALSRMFEASIPEEVNTIRDDPSKSDWYTTHIKEVLANPKKYGNWNVRNDKLFYKYPPNIGEMS